MLTGADPQWPAPVFWAIPDNGSSGSVSFYNWHIDIYRLPFLHAVRSGKVHDSSRQKGIFTCLMRDGRCRSCCCVCFLFDNIFSRFSFPENHYKGKVLKNESDCWSTLTKKNRAFCLVLTNESPCAIIYSKKVVPVTGKEPGKAILL